jgi:hypothetical protein
VARCETSKMGPSIKKEKILVQDIWDDTLE